MKPPKFLVNEQVSVRGNPRTEIVMIKARGLTWIYKTVCRDTNYDWWTEEGIHKLPANTLVPWSSVLFKPNSDDQTT